MKIETECVETQLCNSNVSTFRAKLGSGEIVTVKAFKKTPEAMHTIAQLKPQDTLCLVVHAEDNSRTGYREYIVDAMPASVPASVPERVDIRLNGETFSVTPLPGWTADRLKARTQREIDDGAGIADFCGWYE